jgi:hypothetical protein
MTFTDVLVVAGSTPRALQTRGTISTHAHLELKDGGGARTETVTAAAAACLALAAVVVLLLRMGGKRLVR